MASASRSRTLEATGFNTDDGMEFVGRVEDVENELEWLRFGEVFSGGGKREEEPVDDCSCCWEDVEDENDDDCCERTIDE